MAEYTISASYVKEVEVKSCRLTQHLLVLWWIDSLGNTWWCLSAVSVVTTEAVLDDMRDYI
jgi:hypothetical protein